MVTAAGFDAAGLVACPLAPPAITSTTAATLTLEDAEAMEDTTRITAAAAVAPELQSAGQLVNGSTNTVGRIIGTSSEYPEVRDLTVAEGDWFDDTDYNQSKSVVVLGATVATTLFPADDPINKTIKINRMNFTVVGVMAAMPPRSASASREPVS